MPIKSTPDINLLKTTFSDPMPPGTADPSTNSASETQPLQSNAPGSIQTAAATELASRHMHQPTSSQTYNRLPQQQQNERRFSSTAAPPAAPTHSYNTHSSSSNGSSSSIENTTTPLVWLVVWSVACAGFLLGYASGANVAVAQVFRELFLPQLLDVMPSTTAAASGPCGQLLPRLSWYLAPKYIAGFVSALPVGLLIRYAGRRTALGLGCACFVLAHLLRGTTSTLAVLLAGQGLDGVASAFLYQAPYQEVIEVAPVRWRGAFAYAAQIGRAIGLICRALLVQGITVQPGSPSWGWRLAVLFPIWPACVFALLVPLLPETPNSLMQRGQLAAARAALQEIRGPLVDVEDEFQHIMDAAGIEHGKGQSLKSQFGTFVRLRQLPPLVILLVLIVVREFTGADFLLSYSPALELGLGLEDTSGMFLLRSLANIGFFLGAVLGALLVDTWGRRPTLMLSSMGGCCIYTLLAGLLTVHNQGHISTMPGPIQATIHASVILAYSCYAIGVAMGYFVLVVELFPLCTRWLAMSLTQGLTFCMYAASSSIGLWSACNIGSRMLWLYAAVNAFATVFVYLCLPETRRVPLEDICHTFNTPPHWLWKRCYPPQKHSTSNRHRRASTRRRPS